MIRKLLHKVYKACKYSITQQPVLKRLYFYGEALKLHPVTAPDQSFGIIVYSNNRAK